MGIGRGLWRGLALTVEGMGKRTGEGLEEHWEEFAGDVECGSEVHDCDDCEKSEPAFGSERERNSPSVMMGSVEVLILLPKPMMETTEAA